MNKLFFKEYLDLILEDNQKSISNASVSNGVRSRFGTVPGELLQIILNQIKSNPQQEYCFNLSKFVREGRLSHYFMIKQLEAIVDGCDHDIMIFFYMMSKYFKPVQQFKKAFVNRLKADYKWVTNMDELNALPSNKSFAGQCYFKGSGIQKIQNGCIIFIYKYPEQIKKAIENADKNLKKIVDSDVDSGEDIKVRYLINKSEQISSNYSYSYVQATILHQLQHYFDALKQLLYRRKGKKKNPENIFQLDNNNKNINQWWIQNWINWLNKNFDLGLDARKFSNYYLSFKEIGPQITDALHYYIHNYFNTKQKWNKFIQVCDNKNAGPFIKNYFKKVNGDKNQLLCIYLCLNFRINKNVDLRNMILKQAEDILNHPKMSKEYFLTKYENSNNNIA